jgi:hypothetical protein
MDCIRSSKLFGTLLRKLSLTRWVETLKLALRGGPLHTVGVNALRFFHGAKSLEACCGVKFQTACKQTISTRLHTHTLPEFPVPMASRTPLTSFRLDLVPHAWRNGGRWVPTVQCFCGCSRWDLSCLQRPRTSQSCFSSSLQRGRTRRTASLDCRLQTLRTDHHDCGVLWAACGSYR